MMDAKKDKCCDGSGLAVNENCCGFPMTAPAQIPSEPRQCQHGNWNAADCKDCKIKSLQAECERLRVDLKLSKQGWENCANMMRAEIVAKEQAERKLAEAVAALRKYGRHEEDCMFEMALNKHYKCTCGFDEVTK
jgi:hypothetical protein